MNEILQLKGTLQDRSYPRLLGPRNVPKNSAAITSSKLEILAGQLRDIGDYWNRQDIIDGCLVDVCYIDVIAKSNRVSGLLSSGGSSNDSIVGARFANGEPKKHVITHHIDGAVIQDTVKKIEVCKQILDAEFGGSIDHEQINGLRDRSIDYEGYGIKKHPFRNIIVDCHYVGCFSVPNNRANMDDQSIITVYRTNTVLVDLMKRVGINVQPDRILSETTLFLRPDEIKLLSEKAPYLIAMATVDLSELSLDTVTDGAGVCPVVTIDSPTNEPVIGVIDTLFDKSVYFSEWVEYRKMIGDDIPTDSRDYKHGTSVSSIIVDGPTINPGLDDGCGRFRVRHFGVATHRPYSAFWVMKTIREIVISNPDIRVWNLSLGSEKEINPNFISPEAAILDQIQHENDVIFVVAGTNNNDDTKKLKRMIGAPADSINAIVVNSVNSAGKPASYSRKGLVLSFFNKPDVSSFGGDDNDCIRVCTPLGEGLCAGTSFAAPWVTRKIAYLIEVLGLSREVAKALLVDAAAGWNGVSTNSRLAPIIGHGVVPQRIEDIVKTADDEIKFIISGTSEKWETYAYNLPVPINNNSHPFIAKATLCYFPRCSVNQGVDYTNTELDLSFGRIKGSSIQTINKNNQNNEDGERHYIYEGTARELYRKWDNTKHISDKFGRRVVARKKYGNGMWGLSIKAKARLGQRDEINFGLVVTLKEVNGVNRISDFVRNCELLGWLVNRVNVDSRIDIYNKAQESVTFDA